MSINENITSTSNQKIKAAKLVRDGLDPASIFVEGVRLVEEALDSRASISACFFSSEFGGNARSEKLLERLNQMDIDIYTTSVKVFDSLAATKSSQGVVLICDRPKQRELPQASDAVDRSIRIFLYEISDPSNLGACIRSAAAAGVRAILISPRSADPFSPKALRASMGAAFKVEIIEKCDPATALAQLRSANVITIAADVSGDVEYTEADWTRPTMLVIGSESHGLPHEILDMVSEKVRIPMSAGVESLNLAVSASIILFEAQRQRRLSRQVLATD